jgi:ABC-type Fe3+-hydroxamate transport system substrate-binding protein
MFVNFSNHPSKTWSSEQLGAARQFGDIVDVAFPEVDPKAEEPSVVSLAHKYTNKIVSLKPDAVLCQGEFTLAYAVITLLISRGIKVLAACSQRTVIDTVASDGSIHKTAVFEFIRFREYGKGLP